MERSVAHRVRFEAALRSSRRTPPTRRAASLVASTIWLLAVGCAAEPTSGGDGGHIAPPAECPVGWVRSAPAGCGPPVLLCAGDGGAVPGACDDAGTAPLRRAADGAVIGAWPEPGDPNGPPPEDWSPAVAVGVPTSEWEPDAGIRSCPKGWSMTADGVCDPRLSDSCPAGSAPLPGGRCTRTAEQDCPASAYPHADPNAPHTVYVMAGAGASVADGSEAHPFPTLAQGIERAGDGGTVLVAAGRYLGPFALRRGTTRLLGLCASRVIITAERGATALTVDGAGVSLELGGVTLVGPGAGIRVAGGAGLYGRDLVLRGQSGFGLNAVGVDTTARVTNSVIQGEPEAALEDVGVGVNVGDGASLELRDTALLDLRGSALRVATPTDTTSSRATLGDVVARGLRTSSGAAPSAAIVGMGRSDVTLERVVALENHGHGLFATGGAEVRVTDTILRASTGDGLRVYDATVVGTRTLVDGSGDSGVACGSQAVVELNDSEVRGTLRGRSAESGCGVRAVGGTARLRGVKLIDNYRHGASVEDGANAVLSDVFVRAAPVPDVAAQYGLSLERAARATATRLRVIGMLTAGVRVISPGSTLRLLDASVTATRPHPSGQGGFGAFVGDGAELSVARVRIEDSHGAGVLVSGRASRLDAEHLLVRGTRAGANDYGGLGIQAQQGVTVSLRHSALVDNAIAGASVIATPAAPARLTLTDTLVRGNAPSSPTINAGGVVVGDHGAAILERVRLDENGLVGVNVSLPGASASLTRCLVRETRAGRSGRAGYGLQVSQGALLEATRTRVVRSHEAGVSVASAGTRATLTESVIEATLQGVSNAPGAGIAAEDGARLVATGVRVDSNTQAGVIAVGRGTELTLDGCAILRTRLNADGRFGVGLHAGLEARVSMRNGLISDATEYGVGSFGTGARVELFDSVVMGVSATRQSDGVGIAAQGGGAVIGERVAVQDTSGVGVAALTSDRPALVELGSLFVRRVARRIHCAHGYGIYVGPMSHLTSSHATLVESDYGYFNNAGTISLRAGLISEQRVAAGATVFAGAAPSAQLIRQGNADDAIRVDPSLCAAPLLFSAPPLR